MRRRFHRMPAEVRAEIVRRAKAGQSQRQIVREVDVSSGAVRSVLRPFGGVLGRTSSWSPSPARLSLDDRIEIAVGLKAGVSFRAIGRAIGRDHSTISREVNANGGRDDYRSGAAHERARVMARRPKPTKLAQCPALRARVERGLERLWSPEEIAGELRDVFGNDPCMTVSHETIYKSLFVQGRGELRRELASCLRTGRAARRPQSRLERGRIPNMVLISERPAEIEDRAVPGHWEGDLIIGKDGHSQVGTLVERSTGYLLLLHLPNTRTAEEVRDAMTAKIATLPAALVRSITWDQGIEMAQHATFTVATGVPVYFCEPRSPWQRGSNENTNGLLRQYLPKGTDLSVHTEADLDQIARSLNTRPRKRFAWKTPGYQLDKLIGAMTA